MAISVGYDSTTNSYYITVTGSTDTSHYQAVVSLPFPTGVAAEPEPNSEPKENYLNTLSEGELATLGELLGVTASDQRAAS